VNNRARFPGGCLWTACEVRGVDPQATPAGASPRRPAGGPGGNRGGAVRRLLHTGIPLRDSRHALFPTVPNPYSYNL
jgi:hypothetical protein